MGVRTKVFGRYAWLLLEGVANFFDEYITEETDPLCLANMKSYLTEFYFLLGFVLPCIYCRISYQEFTDPEHPHENTDLYKMLTLKDGAKRFVYNLHGRVNNKLFHQELAEVVHDKEQTIRVHEKWDKHNISFETALRTRFPRVDSECFWHSMIVFMALAMCDFRAEYSCYLYRFFWVMGKMFAYSDNAKVKRLTQAYIEGMKQSLPLWKSDMNLSERLDIVWLIKKHIFNVGHWKFNHTRASFEEKCRASIVGCDKTTKSTT